MALCVSLALVSTFAVSPSWACRRKALIYKTSHRLIRLEKQIDLASFKPPAEQEEYIDLDECINCIDDYYEACEGSCNTCYYRLRKRCDIVIERIEDYIERNYHMN